MFRVFHLVWSTWPATKTFVAGRRNTARWLVDLLGHEQICCATSYEFDEKRATKPKFVAQSSPALYFSQQLSSTRNKCFCCTTSWSCKVKNGKHREKLATKQCCATSWGFLRLVFRRLYQLITHRKLWSIAHYMITKSMRPLCVVNQPLVIVPVNPRKNRTSSELLYKSNRPQVSTRYRLINHLGCW